MNNKLIKICFSLFILISASNIYAQESLIKDIDFPYLEKLIATAKKNYPEIQVKQKQVDIAKGSFHQASWGWLEAFNASYIYSPQSSINITQPTIFKGYQLVATVSLGSLFERPYTIHNARESVKVAEYQKKEYELNLEKQVSSLYFAYVEAQAELRNREKAVTDATILADQLKYTFQKNQTPYEVYSQALTNVSSQTSFKLQAELALLNAKTSLEELLGVKLESIK